MAAHERSRSITAVYRTQLIALRNRTAALAASMWPAVDPARPDETLPPTLDALDVVLTVAQAEAVGYSALYLEAFLTSELDEPIGTIPLDSSRYAGRTRDGRTTRSVLAKSGSSMYLASQQPGANRSSIMVSGLARMIRAVRTETVDAGRTAQGHFMDTDDRVDGYYRATSGEPCPACLAVAGQRFATDTVFPLHGSCQCTAEPIAAGVRDAAKLGPPIGREIAGSMSPEQVESIWGPERAKVLAGGGSLDVFVETSEAREWGSMLYAAPVSRIVA